MLKHHLFWPLAVLAALLLFNLIYSPDFFEIQVRDGHLYGSLIDILNYGAPLILVSLGMTLVIATKGIDLSVGSVMAIAGTMACLIISKGDNQSLVSLVLIAVGVSLILALVLGLWNGILVAKIGIQPIIATLILMVAGQIITISSTSYKYIGSGALLMLPFPIFIAIGVLVIASMLTRKTALGLFIESVGGNPTASRLAGIRASAVMLAVYMFCGLCAGIAGLILTSNISGADGNNAGLWYELDAILAVVIGGTSLNGGRFYLTGTLIGALIIQTLTTTIYMVGVPPETILVVKAFVVMIVCLIQSEAFRKRVSDLWISRTKKAREEVQQHV
jgi:ribose/xylose/arabinose/galactoside ABC-type transport system permease subunit